MDKASPPAMGSINDINRYANIEIIGNVVIPYYSIFFISAFGIGILWNNYYRYRKKHVSKCLKC